MSNTEKKLDALIYALGFDVETKLDFDERKESPSNQELYTSPQINYPHTKGRRLAGSFGASLDIDKDGNYTSRLIDPIRSYKLTKRNPKQTQSELIVELAQELYKQSITSGLPMCTIKYNNLTLKYIFDSGTMEIINDENI